MSNLMEEFGLFKVWIGYKKRGEQIENNCFRMRISPCGRSVGALSMTKFLYK